MPSDPTFSLVIPCHNYARFLPTTFAGIAAQGRDDIEVIVIDDASTDETPDVVAASDLPIRYVRLEENVGPARAWAEGIDLATGDYVCKLDADDWQLPGFLDTVADGFERDDRVGLVVCSAFLYIQASDRAFAEYVTSRPTTLDARKARRRLLRDFFFRMPASAVRRAALEGHAPPRADLRLPHDWEFLLRALDGWRFQLFPEPLAVYRVHGASLTVTSDREERLRRDVQRFLDATRNPDDPAYLRPAERSLLARGLGESYLGAIGPRLQIRHPKQIVDHVRFALGLALSEDPRSAVGVVGYLLRGIWQRYVSRRLRTTVPLERLLPPGQNSSR